MGNYRNTDIRVRVIGILAGVLCVLAAVYAWAEEKAIFTGCDRHMVKTYGGTVRNGR